MIKRAIVVVLDSLGIGALPDAQRFGDCDSHTLKSCFQTGVLHIPNLCKMGLGNIEGNEFLPSEQAPMASFGRMAEKSMGKDTTVGHWELAGVVSPAPLPVYPEGFPLSLMEEFSRRVGRGWLCNRPFSGTEVIRLYGEEHRKTGKLIVYTSADSVFQIAAHEEVVPLSELYEICREARALLQGEHAVGRVIARPFIGEEKTGFVRTANRRDFSLPAPKPTVLDGLAEQGLDVIAVGKISDIFASRGITASHKTKNNAQGVEVLLQCLAQPFQGLLFVNLVDFDSSYGHRNDSVGYARALNAFDEALPAVWENMGEEDLLIVTADHGCDPGTPSTDHSREYVPLLVYGKRLSSVNLGTRDGFSDVAATLADLFSLKDSFLGASFGSLLKGE